MQTPARALIGCALTQHNLAQWGTLTGDTPDSVFHFEPAFLGLSICKTCRIAVAIERHGRHYAYLVGAGWRYATCRDAFDGSRRLTRISCAVIGEMNALRQSSQPVVTKRADVVVTICTFRKRARPTVESTPASLPIDTQDKVQAAWVERVRRSPSELAAGEIYAGRGFSLASRAAEIASAKLYILSAGLGLIAADRKVPLYGLTVSAGHSESIAARVRGEFDPGAWFSGLQSSPLSDRWVDAVGRGSGRILIALTRPYAQMVGESLAALSPQVLARLRIFGASLASVLPTALHPALAPYDARLEAVLPGTRSDFSQRALYHFVSLVADDRQQDCHADYEAVASALAEVTAPERARRPRRSDAELLELIAARLQSQVGVARILRALRDEEGVACEQSRFSRLYQIALQKREAA